MDGGVLTGTHVVKFFFKISLLRAIERLATQEGDPDAVSMQASASS
jgi:hypothetical protein